MFAYRRSINLAIFNIGIESNMSVSLVQFGVSAFAFFCFKSLFVPNNVRGFRYGFIKNGYEIAVNPTNGGFFLNAKLTIIARSRKLNIRNRAATVRVNFVARP